jgi:SnoaL-like domain
VVAAGTCPRAATLASPPLLLDRAAGAARAVDLAESRHVLVRQLEVEDLTVLGDALAVGRLRDDRDLALEAPAEREGSEPTYALQGREALTPVFDDLNRYEATTHFNGQSTVTIDGNRATGESYTIAHHVYTEDGTRKIMIASLRYLDTFTKSDGRWYFAERNLILDWSETRSLAGVTAA